MDRERIATAEASIQNRAAGSLSVLGVDPEAGFAGGETQVLGLTLELLRRGHRAELACSPRGRLFERAMRAGVKCHPLSIRNALDVAAAVRLRRLLVRGHYDVVHFHTARAHAMAPFVRGCAPALAVTRRMDYRPNRLFAPYLYNRTVDKVAAISSAVADALIRAGVAPERITVIPSGVDCRHFSPPTELARMRARERLGIAAGEIAVGSVGMLEARKGHRYLIEAIAKLAGGSRQRQPIVCFLAGEGSLRGELVRLSGELGIGASVKLLGLVRDSRAVLDALDVFVFPSLKEGLGVALLEAMACGLPVVASAVGGLREVVEDRRTGWLVAAGDASAIAEAIGSLAEDQGLRRTMGAAARQRACEKFSMESMAGQTLDLYRACLARRGA